MLKLKLLIICALLWTSAIQAATCDRIIFPRQQQIDLIALGEYVGNHDLCHVDGQSVRCKDEKTGTTVCLKCLSGSTWLHVKDKVYRCTEKNDYDEPQTE